MANNIRLLIASTLLFGITTAWCIPYWLILTRGSYTAIEPVKWILYAECAFLLAVAILSLIFFWKAINSIGRR